MKIALATPYYVSGFGIENRVTELIKHLPPNIDKKNTLPPVFPTRPTGDNSYPAAQAAASPYVS